jgi:hypothetical protein
MSQQHELTVLPGVLSRRATESYAEIDRLVRQPGQQHVQRRLAAVAAQLSDLVPAVVADPDAISAEQVSDVRLGALALAATVGQLTDEGRLPQWYVDVAAGITALERHAAAGDSPNETIVLVQA